jgi:hypothetical protein
MVSWQQVLSLKGFMDGSSHPSVCDGSESRFHLSNQQGKLLITSLGEVDIVPDPAGLGLGTKAQFDIKRGTNCQSSGWKFIIFPPTQLIFGCLGEILDPNRM